MAVIRDPGAAPVTHVTAPIRRPGNDWVFSGAQAAAMLLGWNARDGVMEGMIGIRSLGATHPGAHRSANQDAFLDRPEAGLWAVADGAGGHASGEVASAAIVAALSAIPAGLDAAELLAEVRAALDATHAAMREEASRRGPNEIIASTVVVLLARDDHFACLWAGDSRAYLLRNDTIQQITRDHSLVQELVDAGQLAAEEAENHPQANIITRALGGEADGLELDKVTGRIEPGDRFLLCSDGVFKTLGDAAMVRVAADADGAQLTEALLRAALEQDAGDNITAVVVAIPPG